MWKDYESRVIETVREIVQEETSAAVNALSAVLAGLEARIKRLESADPVELPRPKKTKTE